MLVPAGNDTKPGPCPCRPIHATLIVEAAQRPPEAQQHDPSAADADGEGPHENGFAKPPPREPASGHRGADDSAVGRLQTDPDWCRQVWPERAPVLQMPDTSR